MLNSLDEKLNDPSLEMYFDKDQLAALKTNFESVNGDMDMKTIMTKMKEMETEMEPKMKEGGEKMSAVF
jgi:hypothetical protein